MQVASAVVGALWELHHEGIHEQWPFLPTIEYWLSGAVIDNLAVQPCKCHDVVRVESSVRDLARCRRETFDIVFTIFGPDYSRTRAEARLLGCADGLVLLGKAREDLPLREPVRRGKRAIKRRLWLRQLRNADVVVEAAHLRHRLVELGIGEERVHVVSNCPHPVMTEATVKPLPGLVRQEDELLLCYPARGHSHKNHRFLIGLHDELRSRGQAVRFIVTLDKTELNNLPPGWTRALDSVGPLRVKDVARLYDACDAVIFPSLLETFSVTPLEALARRKPLFAADLPFVRGIVGDAAGYFDPFDLDSAADAFMDWWHDEPSRQRQVAEGVALVSRLPTARDRVVSYLDLIAGLCSRSFP